MSIDAANPVAPTRPRPAGEDQIGEHVPAELIRRTGMPFSPAFLAGPHEYMAAMHRDLPPIFYDVSPTSNAWQLIKHEDAMFALRNPDIFGNEGGSPFPRDPDDYFYLLPVEIDPPHHLKYRNILFTQFSPLGVRKLDAKIRALANELIDAMIDRGECEFTTAFGRPLPVLVFLDLMGLPHDKCDTFVEWAMNLLHTLDRAVMVETMRQVTEYLNGVIEEKRLAPDDGVISRVVHAEVDGRPMAPKEVFGFVFFLFIAGLDTVFATLNNIWLWLAQNPDRVREIIARPDDIDKVVEELLRRFSVTFSGRSVIRDIEMRGVQIKAGDRITCVLPACNFDPEVFPDPLRVDFDRPRKVNLAFTVGVHSCMGSHLARLEVKIALQEWLRRIPEFAVRPGAEIEYRPGGVIGPEQVPLVW